MGDSFNTKKSFHDKWSNNEGCAFESTITEGSDIFQWILSRNGFDSPDALRRFLSDKRRVLDAGCGNGRVTALLRKYADPDKTHIMGVDLVAADIARKNLQGRANVSFAARDLLGDLSDLGRFDFIYCQEVLHHTSDPARAFSNLVSMLEDDGEIAIYVYKKKAPVREFVDDYVREKIAGLSYEEALRSCEQMTALGKALSELNVKFEVPAVEVLDIDAGEYDIQRFIYHFFMKCFWNPELSEQENIVINYDWYHPQLCSRHTPEEIRDWFRETGLKVIHECVDRYGITMRGVKNA